MPVESLISPQLPAKYRSKDHNFGVAKVPIREPDVPRRPMSTLRRNRLEEIRQRENNREKRERVAKILTRRLVIKYGRYGDLHSCSQFDL